MNPFGESSSKNNINDYSKLSPNCLKSNNRWFDCFTSRVDPTPKLANG